ncbi:hypothetical protein NLI96_g8540 [Meripilus lineatus]|uniref:DUF6535 domain-containing protein n=1 Tax=Meripilus lineatus TaxID=2056292 RepID=A0AAD5YG48_9APHY|nr:hypothetical protein NLI96_g8540 [Physisporinus lineatus]
MDTNFDATESKNPSQKSPTLSMRSGRSGSARRRKKSWSVSSGRSTHSAESSEAEVPPNDEGHQIHEVEVETEGPVDDSSVPSMPADGSIPASLNDVNSSLQTMISLLREHLSRSGKDPVTQQGNQNDDSGHGLVDKDKVVEEEEEILEAEKECRQWEKECPEVSFKPEETNAWPELSDTLRKHDEDQVKAHNENIDTLLVLSGLFSAVVTTLGIEALKQLQQDPADTTAQVLQQISMQLNSLSVNPGFINSTFVPPPPSPFSPRPNAVVVNVLWFISLVLSLVTASLGMLVKQWFREFLAKSNVSPEQCCQVRQFRIPGLRKYKVTEIAGFLPIILQIALVLFFIGLILFIRPIHTSVANYISVFVGIWLSFIVVTTLLPLFSPSCPYKTPVLKSIFFHTRTRMGKIYDWARGSVIGSRFRFLPDRLFIEESTEDMSIETKVEVLMETYETFRDTKSWDIITRCMNLNLSSTSLWMLSLFVERMHGSEVTSLSDFSNLFDQAQLRFLLKSMVACLRTTFILALRKTDSTRLTHKEAVAVITLQKLYWYIPLSGDVNWALYHMSRQLKDTDCFSIPHDPGFTSSYILLNSGIPSRELPKAINNDQMSNVIKYATQALDSGSGNGAEFKCSDSRPHLMEICHTSFLCAGRATEDGRDEWKAGFSQLTVRLASSLQFIPYSEGLPDTSGAFRAQCALDMAMRLHTKVPGIVDKSLFQAIHDYSISMFKVSANYRGWYERGDIKRRNDAPGNVPDADWKKLLDKKEEYVGVQLRRDGNYGNEWYDDDLQNSCKRRIEFLWSKGSEYFEEKFREILREFEVGSKT